MSFSSKLSNIQRMQLKLFKVAETKRCHNCSKFSLFPNGFCHTHFSSQPKSEVPNVSLKSEGQKSNAKCQHVRSRIMEAAKAGRHPEEPAAASELEFKIDNPPETFREPSKAAVVDSESEFTENDVVLQRTTIENDCASKGNLALDKLVCDFQPYYIMANKKRSIAKSLVYVVQNRGGRFFQIDDSVGHYHELSDDVVVEKVMQLLVRGLKEVTIRVEANRLMALNNPPGLRNPPIPENEEPRPPKRVKPTMPKPNLETIWNRNYQQLVEFHRIHGHCALQGHNKPV